MAKLNTYLFFNGNCQEAMNFYKDGLGGELYVMTGKDSPSEYQIPGKEDWVMHASLDSKSGTLMASDWMMEGEPEEGTNYRICLVCDSPDEAKEIWGKLTQGGNIFDELSEKFFGWYGAFEDKFGVRWMIQANQAKE